MPEEHVDFAGGPEPEHPVQYDENGNVIVQPMKDVPE